LRNEVARLRRSAAQAETTLAEERARGDQLDDDLRTTRVQLDSEASARRAADDRNVHLITTAEARQERLAAALAEATEQARAAEAARQELAQVRAEHEDMRALEARNAGKIATLLREQTNSLQKLEAARSRGEDLEAQIASARDECEDVHRALDDASKEKDRLLHAQASEHHRALRDHIAETDGDRAVLEHQFSELRAAAEDATQRAEDARADAEVAHSDAAGLREELSRVEAQLREARGTERVLRDDLRVGRASASEYEARLESSARLLAQMLEVALSFRATHLKALAAAQAMSAHPGTTTAKSVSGSGPLADSVFSSGLSFTSPGLRRPFLTPADEPEPIDPSDPASALDKLCDHDHDAFLEAIQKTGATIRKWQKQCKEYRERAKGRIAFRNFARGDLALFLPTRNSVSKPWAAFNGVWRRSSYMSSLTDGGALPRFSLVPTLFLARDRTSCRTTEESGMDRGTHYVHHRAHRGSQGEHCPFCDKSKRLILPVSIYRIRTAIRSVSEMASSITCSRSRTGRNPLRRRGGHPQRRSASEETAMKLSTCPCLPWLPQSSLQARQK
jgi:autophagy-related protein 11